MIFTDGEENTTPMINEVSDEVCEYNATVYSMILTNVASNHPLIALSQETCGAACVYDDTSLTTMYDCMWSALKTRVPKIAPVEVSSPRKLIKCNNSYCIRRDKEILEHLFISDCNNSCELQILMYIFLK